MLCRAIYLLQVRGNFWQPWAPIRVVLNFCVCSTPLWAPSPSESTTWGQHRHLDGISMLNAGVVADTKQASDSHSSHPQKEQKDPSQVEEFTPSQALQPSSVQDIWEWFQKRGYPSDAAGLATDSWRPATQLLLLIVCSLYSNKVPLYIYFTLKPTLYSQMVCGILTPFSFSVSMATCRALW